MEPQRPVARREYRNFIVAVMCWRLEDDVQEAVEQFAQRNHG